MKKANTVWISLFLLLHAVIPSLSLTASCFGGYHLVLHHCVALAIGMALLSVTLTVAAWVVGKDQAVSTLDGVLGALSLPVAAINGFLVFLKGNSMWAGGLMIFGFVCALVLVIRFTKPMALKVVTMTLSLLIALTLGFFSFVVFLFGQLDGVRTTVKMIPSPQGTHKAEIIDSDQGALGGDTLVVVSANNPAVNLYVFALESSSETVYVGEWKEYERMNVYWKDEDTLVIHGKEYPVG